MIIKLTRAECEEATAIGLKREALRASRGKSLGKPADRGGTWDDRNIVGAKAEAALAKHFDVLDRWRAEQAFSLEHEKITSDIGNKAQIRATSLDHGNLLLHDYDPDAPFICAVVAADSVDVKGWIPARLGKVKAYWRNTGPFYTRPCYVIPVEDLFCITTLTKESI